MGIEQKGEQVIVSAEGQEAAEGSNSSGVRVFLVIFSLACAVLGFYLAEHIRDDELQPIFVGLGILGAIGAIAGFIGPIISKNNAKGFSLHVYRDHVEGRCPKTTGTLTQVQEFYEKFENLSSVSLAANTIVINLKDGSNLRCPASNARTVADVIRSKI